MLLPGSVRVPTDEQLALKKEADAVNAKVLGPTAYEEAMKLYKGAGDTLEKGKDINSDMFAYLDGDFLNKAVDYIKKGGKPNKLKGAGIVPNMQKRGAVRPVYDGCYVYSRYFSPKQHNRPTTLEDLHRVNDVELFDAQADPLEMVNLAMPNAEQRELVVAMNDKLNRLMDSEVGENRGRMLPGGIDAGWEVTAETMAP